MAESNRQINKNQIVRAAVSSGTIDHILIIDLENENFSATFSANSPAVYLNSTLLKQGQLLVNYFATSHVSLGNYLSQVSGQGPTESINNDCINLASLTKPPVIGGFTNILPGTDTGDQISFPGQVVGDGCVFPAPTSTSRGALTIGDQLDAKDADQKNDEDESEHRESDAPQLNWRSYAEDMGNNPLRDYGKPDPLGGTTCAHAPIGGVDNSNTPGSINTPGYYNHYSALRSFEDILGITRGGDDGYGHLGYASVPGLNPFGPDVFNRRDNKRGDD